MNFAKLMDKSNSGVDKFRDAIEKDSGKGFQKDESYWRPKVDDAGNGYAIIRFLPTPPQDGEDGLPWVKYFSHGFKGPTGYWYIENSLTTLGKDDPVSDYNSKLWATGLDENKKIAREQKRKLVYVSNVYVVSDPANKENEGKVFRFKYGKKIFEKIDEAMNPGKYDPSWDKDDHPAINPFHLLEGANFRLKIRKVEGYTNYDKSEFDKPTQLLGGDPKKLEALWQTQYSLKELIAPSHFKDYVTLKQQLDRVLGIQTSSSHPATPADEEVASPITSKTAEGVVVSSDDEDDDLFRDLAEPR